MYFIINCAFELDQLNAGLVVFSVIKSSLYLSISSTKFLN